MIYCEPTLSTTCSTTVLRMGYRTCMPETEMNLEGRQEACNNPERRLSDCSCCTSVPTVNLCFSQYGQSGQYHIQHFPHHFSYQQDCTMNCHHETLYLITSGNHYDLATILLFCFFNVSVDEFNFSADAAALYKLTSYYFISFDHISCYSSTFQSR